MGFQSELHGESNSHPASSRSLCAILQWSIARRSPFSEALRLDSTALLLGLTLGVIVMPYFPGNFLP